MAALGVGIGVDYGICIFSCLRALIGEGRDLRTAFRGTLDNAGKAVLVTGPTLAMGVSTWIFSVLQFQADRGVLLTFMFLANMPGAILLLPSLAAFLLPRRSRPRAPPTEPRRGRFSLPEASRFRYLFFLQWFG